MKLSLALAFGAGVASAAPLQAGRDAAKLPFKQPDKTVKNCGVSLFFGDTDQTSEACVGTLEYCRNEFFKQHGETFAGAQECLQSRQAAAAAALPSDTPASEPADTTGADDADDADDDDDAVHFPGNTSEPADTTGADDDDDAVHFPDTASEPADTTPCKVSGVKDGRGAMACNDGEDAGEDDDSVHFPDSAREPVDTTPCKVSGFKDGTGAMACDDGNGPNL